MEKTFELSFTVKLLFTEEYLTEDKAREMAVSELWEKYGIDVRSCDLENERERICVPWSIKDVQQVRPDLTDEQAYEVLVAYLDSYDAAPILDDLRDVSEVIYPAVEEEL